MQEHAGTPWNLLPVFEPLTRPAGYFGDALFAGPKLLQARARGVVVCAARSIRLRAFVWYKFGRNRRCSGRDLVRKRRRIRPKLRIEAGPRTGRVGGRASQASRNTCFGVAQPCAQHRLAAFAPFLYTRHTAQARGACMGIGAPRARACAAAHSERATSF